MRLGVDAHVLQGKFQGSRTYLWNLYRAYLERRPAHDAIFFGDWRGEAPFGESHVHTDFPSRSRLRRILVDAARTSRDHRIGVFHCQYIAPFGLKIPTVVTIHDILFESHPTYFDFAQRLRNRLLVRRSANMAAQVHTVSEYSRQAICSIYGIDPERVFVVPNGVDTALFHPVDREASIARVLARRGLLDPIVSVGRLEPRKNHLSLLKAYENVCRDRPQTGPLVLVGQPDFHFKSVFTAIEQHPFRARIHILSDVSDEELPDLYRAAALFAYPSFAEGFGIPPLEALACGVPTICSNTTSIPEVVGDAAVLVKPDAVDDLTHAMLKVLNDARLAEELALRGPVQASRWTWGSAAERFDNALSRLVNHA
jgi:glycosyltransferase involved in cell wall biosynthesis